MPACLLEMLARSAFGLYFVPKFGFLAAGFSSPAAWIMADALLVPAFFVIMKNLNREKKDLKTA